MRRMNWQILLIGAGTIALGVVLYFAWKVRQPLSLEEQCEQQLTRGERCELRLFIPTDRPKT